MQLYLRVAIKHHTDSFLLVSVCLQQIRIVTLVDDVLSKNLSATDKSTTASSAVCYVRGLIDASTILYMCNIAK